MRAPPANVTAANAGEFVQARLKAGRFASEALGALDAGGVDAEALQLGRELMAWYREEVTLNERATSLLGSASAADRKGAAGNSWRSGEEQHRRKCDEINRHGAALRAHLRASTAWRSPRSIDPRGAPPAQRWSAVTDSGNPTGPIDW